MNGQIATVDIEYDTGTDLPALGYAAYPEASAPKASILVAPPGPGLNDRTLWRARLLAEQGYFAFAMDPYGGRKQAVGMEEVESLINPLRADPNLLRRKVKAALDTMTARSQVDPGKVAAIGFCFGGLAVLELARSGAPVRATVAFHGLIENKNPDDVHNIKGRVLVCTGADDPLVPPEQVATFESEMRQTKIDWQVQVYGGVRHGFTNRGAQPNEISRYDENAERRSWSAMLDLFTLEFGTPQ
ncbi:MAG: dienelactone hydrolase family protein [Rhizobiaceae bacterium]|nr:dienelactone hydrolase family protein [Rhizobiaceae bacterium]